MLKKFKILLIVVSVAYLSGCASGPKFTEMQSKIETVNPTDGRIYFYRPEPLFGGGIRPKVYLNGKHVGESMPAGYFYLDRKPGDYRVSLTSETEKELTFQLDSGEEKYVRLSVGLGVIIYRVYPELQSKDQALKELQELSYIGSIENPYTEE